MSEEEKTEDQSRRAFLSEEVEKLRIEIEQIEEKIVAIETGADFSTEDVRYQRLVEEKKAIFEHMCYLRNTLAALITIGAYSPSLLGGGGKKRGAKSVAAIKPQNRQQTWHNYPAPVPRISDNMQNQTSDQLNSTLDLVGDSDQPAIKRQKQFVESGQDGTADIISDGDKLREEAHELISDFLTDQPSHTQTGALPTTDMLEGSPSHQHNTENGLHAHKAAVLNRLFELPVPTQPASILTETQPSIQLQSQRPYRPYGKYGNINPFPHLPDLQLDAYTSRKNIVKDLHVRFGDKKIVFVALDGSDVTRIMYQRIKSSLPKDAGLEVALRGSLERFVVGVDKKKGTVTYQTVFLPEYRLAP
jgi:hypothetical protein